MIKTIKPPDYIGKKLKSLREKTGMNMYEFASHSGVPYSTIREVENGPRQGRHLTIETAKRLAGALLVTLDRFCAED